MTHWDTMKRVLKLFDPVYGSKHTLEVKLVEARDVFSASTRSAFIAVTRQRNGAVRVSQPHIQRQSFQLRSGKWEHNITFQNPFEKRAPVVLTSNPDFENPDFKKPRFDPSDIEHVKFYKSAMDYEDAMEETILEAIEKTSDPDDTWGGVEFVTAGYVFRESRKAFIAVTQKRNDEVGVSQPDIKRESFELRHREMWAHDIVFKDPFGSRLSVMLKSNPDFRNPEFKNPQLEPSDIEHVKFYKVSGTGEMTKNILDAIKINVFQLRDTWLKVAEKQYFNERQKEEELMQKEEELRKAELRKEEQMRKAREGSPWNVIGSFLSTAHLEPSVRTTDTA